MLRLIVHLPKSLKKKKKKGKGKEKEESETEKRERERDRRRERKEEKEEESDAEKERVRRRVRRDAIKTGFDNTTDQGIKFNDSNHYDCIYDIYIYREFYLHMIFTK